MQNITPQVRRYILYFLIAIFAYLAGDQKILNTVLDEIGLNQVNHSSGQGEGQIYLLGKYKVNYVVDGDTFHATDENGKEEVIRIMAVNTLEMKEKDVNKSCFAKKQTAFTKDYLLNKDVYLYADKTQGLLDKYQRILAYVATTTENYIDIQNSYFFNDFLIDTGNADTYKANPPALLFNRFEQKLMTAKKYGLGMWSDSLCK